MAIDLPLRLPQHWLGSTAPKGKGPNNTLRSFVNSVMSYTKMDVPTVELFETAVTFEAKHSDPLSAHQSLSKTLGKKAGGRAGTEDALGKRARELGMMMLRSYYGR